MKLTGSGEAGLTLYMDELHHYDLAVIQDQDGCRVIERLNIGDVKSVEHTAELNDTQEATLIIKSAAERYSFFLKQADGGELPLGTAHTKYLSSEVAGGFTGVLIGLYACGEGASAGFTDFVCDYK
ncbi:hypothetical protein D3C80_1722920 [compost metagenome]